MIRWTHVSEVLDIARLLEGGELLLTTGMALNVPPERQRAYVRELKEQQVSCVMLELGRHFNQVPKALAEAADELGLPLIALPYDTRFVKVTEAIHRELMVARQAAESEELVDDLTAGRIASWEALLPRLQRAGVPLAEPAWFCGAVVPAPLVQPVPVKTGGLRGALVVHSEEESVLLGFGTEPAALGESMSAWARRAGAPSAGVGRCYRDLAYVERTVAEARDAAGIRRRQPRLDPRIERMGVYALLPWLDSSDVDRYVRQWLGPLLDYEARSPGPLLETLRVLLDMGPVTEAARRLYVTRQALYSRRDRIAAVLGADLDDEEARLALAVALRLHEGAQSRWTGRASRCPQGAATPTVASGLPFPPHA